MVLEKFQLIYGKYFEHFPYTISLSSFPELLHSEPKPNKRPLDRIQYCNVSIAGCTSIAEPTPQFPRIINHSDATRSGQRQSYQRVWRAVSHQCRL
jgi:hypothetical protein